MRRSRTSTTPVRAKPTLSSPPAVVTTGPSLGQSIKEGFGFGLGSAIAHRIIGPAPVVVKHESASTEVPLPPEYVRCMKESFNDKELCKEYLTTPPK